MCERVGTGGEFNDARQFRQKALEILIHCTNSSTLTAPVWVTDGPGLHSRLGLTGFSLPWRWGDSFVLFSIPVPASPVKSLILLADSSGYFTMVALECTVNSHHLSMYIDTIFKNSTLKKAQLNHFFKLCVDN